MSISQAKDDDRRALWEEWGYVVFHDVLPHRWCDEARADILAHLDTAKKQPGQYEYSGTPRVFEAWKWSAAVRAIAIEKAGYAADLIGEKVFPFQTINFIRGSAQPLHQDALHFDTIPQGMMLGSWAALEDVTKANGALVICPGSHVEPLVTLQDVGVPLPEDQDDALPYQCYESYIATELAPKYERVRMSVELPKGSVIMWQANLLHGGGPIEGDRTRWSQATHMYLHGAERYYSPMFSNPAEGVWADKDLSTKDILGLGVPK